MPSEGSQKLTPSPLCLPLSKFSYATVSNESIAPIPWLHISGKNRLFAVFETSPMQLEDGRFEDRQRFKVLQDPEVMEELDLNALAAEANRAMAQPTNMLNPQGPDVTVIVKVPVIAMKYPMNNGQIRRFQIRFPSNEDYYEAMKMLSRANVPTLEAGSFPVQKPHTAPPQPHSNLLTPNDSASQVGTHQEDPKLYDQAGALTQAASSSTRCLHTAGPVRPTMGPPAYVPSAMDTAHHRATGESSRVGPSRSRQSLAIQPGAPRSNVSLSTATTLVNSKDNFTVQNTSVAHDAYGGAPNPQGEVSHLRMNLIGHQQPTITPAQVQDSGLGLPPRRTLPFRRTESTVDENLACAPESKASSIHEKNELGNLPVSAGRQEPAKGKRKRGAAKPTTAKKPRAPATRKKAGGKAAADDQPVPTVEQLLNQSDSFPRTTPQNVETKRTEISDSEPRSTRHEAGATASPSLGAPTRRVTRSASKALASAEGQNITENGPGLARDNPCTPADQMIMSLTPGSPEAQHSRDHALPQDEPPRARQEVPPSSSFACADLLPKKPEASVEQFMSALDGLEGDHEFATAIERLHAWTNQPDADRSAALKAYLCRLIVDPGFGSVCKFLDSFWETEILKAKVERRNTVE